MAATINNLSQTMEDYLETILTLKQEQGFARVGKIAARLKVKSPTVNFAIKYLKNQQLVTHEKYGYIDLTREGEKIATDVKNKHEIIFRFLTEFLMLDPSACEKEACCIEHSISKETLLRLNKFFYFLETKFMAEKSQVLEAFAHYLKTEEKTLDDRY